MPDGIKIDVEMDEAAIGRLTDTEESVMARDLLRRLNRGERQAKVFLSGVRVNVRTGRLRSSVHGELFRSTGGLIGGRLGTDVYYGRFLNDGTRYIRARHWLDDPAVWDAMR